MPFGAALCIGPELSAASCLLSRFSAAVTTGAHTREDPTFRAVTEPQSRPGGRILLRSALAFSIL
jgi:hypothetical protein